MGRSQDEKIYFEKYRGCWGRHSEVSLGGSGPVNTRLLALLWGINFSEWQS